MRYVAKGIQSQYHKECPRPPWRACIYPGCDCLHKQAQSDLVFEAERMSEADLLSGLEQR